MFDKKKVECRWFLSLKGPYQGQINYRKLWVNAPNVEKSLIRWEEQVSYQEYLSFTFVTFVQFYQIKGFRSISIFVLWFGFSMKVMGVKCAVLLSICLRSKLKICEIHIRYLFRKKIMNEKRIYTLNRLSHVVILRGKNAVLNMFYLIIVRRDSFYIFHLC